MAKQTTNTAQKPTIKATEASDAETNGQSWLIDGRKLVKDDQSFSWADTGELIGADEAEGLIALLGSGATEADTNHAARQNGEILFWTPEVAGDDGRPEPNPVRGLPLAFFRRPEWSGGADDEEQAQSEDEGPRRPKLACWLLLTKPTLARTRDKKIVSVPAGKVVWVDVNQAFGDMPAAAAPRMSLDGSLLELFEVAIVPSHKKTLPPKIKGGKPRQAWVMSWYGGRYASSSEGWRRLNAHQIRSLGPLTRTPLVSRIRPEDFPELPGSDSIAALPEASDSRVIEYDQPQG